MAGFLGAILGPLACLCVGGQVAEARETPADETAPPGMQQVYEYVETVTIRGLKTEISLTSNVFVVVTMRGDIIAVELRPDSDPDQPLTRDGDPPRGHVSFASTSGAKAASWPLAPASAEFRFEAGTEGNVSIDGLAGQALLESVAILRQGPMSNSLKADSVSTYDVEIIVDGKPYALRAEQQNGELWVDWMLTGVGEMAVGSGGVQLPVDFTLPERQAGRRGMKLASSARMRYSSVRPGPETETTLTTTLTFPDKDGEATYTRRSELRPVSLRADDTVPPAGRSVPRAVKLLAGDGGGRGGAWSRAATLATLGTQRLAGVREAGLAMWMAQAAVDTVAGRELGRAADRAARAQVALLEKLTPAIQPPPAFVPESIRPGARLRAVVSATSHLIGSANGDTLFEPGKETAAIVPELSMSLRWRKGPRRRTGVGILSAAVGGGETGRHFWNYAAVVGRIEYEGRRFNLGLSAGPGYFQYDFKTGGRVASAGFVAVGAGVDAELMLSKKLGLFGDWRAVGDMVSVAAASILAGARFYMTPEAAIQIHVGGAECMDTEAVGGDISLSSPFDTFGNYGVGLIVRW